MFDTIEQAPAYPQDVKITEKRAPTDASIELVREYETKAWDAIKKSAVQNMGGVEAEFIAVEKMFDTWQTKVAFKINGYVQTVTVDESSNKPKQFEAISKKIAENILMQMMRETR